MKDFIQHLLKKDPAERYTAEEALKHEWITQEPDSLHTPTGQDMSHSPETAQAHEEAK